jgi:hypothetical protein
MPAKEYYEGRDMEKNTILHDYLIEQFKLDDVDSDGASTTKADIVATKDGKTLSMSVKNVSGKNTQVHLTTLNKLSKDLDMLPWIEEKLQYWFGTKDKDTFKKWSEVLNPSADEVKHQRIKSDKINDWFMVENYFNKINKEKTLPKLLIESLKKDTKSEYLVWHNKKTKKVQVVDIPKLIDFISVDCEWITMPSGTVLRCVTPDGKPILWLQMKGNREDGGYNHSPQFHIAENWPQELVIISGVLSE